MSRTIPFFSFFLMLFLLSGGCKSDQSPQTESEFIKEVFQVMAQDDYELFKENFLPDLAFITQIEKAFTKLRGTPYNETEAHNKYKIIQQNAPKLYKKLAWRKLEGAGSPQPIKIDWNDVLIKKITPKFHTLGDILGGELLVDITTRGIDCTIKFRSIYQIGNSHWKIMQYVDYLNCSNTPYHK